MTPTFKKTELFRSPKIVIRKSDLHEWGVFATADIEPMEIIEETPYFVIWEGEYEPASYITTYSYGMSDDMSAIPFGAAGLYNHSEKPNAESSFNEYHRFITHFASKKINAGDEICIDYGVGDPKIFNMET